MPSLEQDSVCAGYNPVGVLCDWYNNDEEESEEVENEETWAKFNIGLHTLLDSITSGGEISSEQHYPLFINPGLEVLDKLPISLPLRPSDAESIRDACRQAPFGRGNDTVVDTSVRKTWELDHTQFRLCNPAWGTFLKDTLLKKVADDLGLESIRAEPYKLLLCEAGSFFKPHKDSEKTPGMIATLVICLPSEHQGGDVHLSFGGTTRVLSTGPGSKFDLTALAWYGDVIHEVKELASGHRLVLTYNIILDSPNSENSVLFLEQAVKLRKMLEDWRWRFSDFISKACYTTAHKYSRTSLSLNILKGRDATMFKVLQSVASDAGFYVFAGHMSYRIEEEGWNETNETEPVLADIFAPDGTVIATSGTTSMQELLDEAQYEGRAPDYTKRSEFTGNTSMFDTLRYYDTVIILTPKEQIMHVVGEHHVGTALSMVLADLERRPNDKIVKDAIREVIEWCVEGSHKPQGSDYARFTEWAVRLNLMRLYEQVTGLYSDYPEIVPAMAKALEWKSQQFLGVLRVPNDVHDLRKALSVFETTLSDPHLAKSFNNWAKTAAALSLGHRNRWLGLDLEMIQEVILEMHEHGDPDWMTSWFIPKLVVRGSRELLVPLTLWAMQPSLFDNEKLVSSILKDALDHFALRPEDFFQLAYLVYPESRYRYVYGHPEGSTSFWDQMTPKQAGFVDLLDESIRGGFLSHFLPVIERTNELMWTDPWRVYATKDGILRVLVSMTNKLQAYQPRPEAAAIISLYKGFLSLVHRGAQLPLYPFDQGWKSPPTGCRNESCKNCRDLDTFLESPTRTTWSLQEPWAARKHIESQLGTSNIFTVETEWTRPSDTLAITKKITFFSQKLAAYHKAFSDLEADFEFLKTDYIRQLLGDIKYRQLVTISDPANRVYAKPFVYTPRGSDRGITLILPSTTADSLSADGPLQSLEPDFASSHAAGYSGGIEPEGNTVDPSSAPPASEGSLPNLGPANANVGPTSQPALGVPVTTIGQKRPSDDAREQYDGREKRMAIVRDD